MLRCGDAGLSQDDGISMQEADLNLFGQQQLEVPHPLPLGGLRFDSCSHGGTALQRRHSNGPRYGPRVQVREMAFKQRLLLQNEAQLLLENALRRFY